ncbi:unnamed protein product [Rotaria sp. Silwood1]|nr:unnamed protein product [Rotaria sp. Silwood1]CAF3326925.1 unnamed protein product [Rotaria sp. Silwood1]CAF3344715.1 unnamed protein product [Rotaria sp. Silwood1]CAF4500414.1 unnamed protein product [Rotaria sp. Silwood1]CAF4542455.1 unnamed protein product [Rotaria sp. Silwood1]
MMTNVQQSKNLKKFSFIWLDTINNDSSECIKIQENLRTFIHDFKKFQNNDKCMKYIESLPNDRFILIINDRSGKKVISHVHYLRQVFSIYIYSSDKVTNKRWIKQYPKIKSFIVKLDELILQIRSSLEQSSQIEISEPLSIRFFRKSNENNEFNDNFIYSKLLNDYLLQTKPISNRQNELISLCKDEYKENENELNIICEFENNYSSNQALWWYTRDTFVYHLLNKAFRIQNIDLLLIFQFFMHDIQRLIQENKYTKSVYVYRSYIISNDELQLLKNSIGEFILINEFFLTNLHRQQALSYLNNNNNNDITNDYEKVLFEIYIDAYIDSNKPYCNITSFNHFSNEEKVLFTLGSIFRVINIQQQDYGKIKLWFIRMKLSNDKHKRFKILFENIKYQYNIEQMNFLSLGKILRKMTKFDDAEKFYRRLLIELPYDHSNIVDCYYNLGIIMDEKGDYESSLEWHEKSIDIKKQTLKTNNPSIGYSYNSIANVYQKKGDYKRALEYYNKTLSIWKNIFGENHPDVAMCLNNMGCVYENEKKYSEALECHQKALAIKNFHLPSNHLHLSATHNNIATVYGCIGQFDLALEHFNLSLKIKLKSLPINHSDIALTFKNIGLIYEMKNDFSQAKLFYEKAAIIRHHIFPSTHCDVIQIEQDMKRVLMKIK